MSPLRCRSKASASTIYRSCEGVKNIVASAKKLAILNIKPKKYDGLGQNEYGIWCLPSTSVRVMWFEDPDGNLLSLSDPVG